MDTEMLGPQNEEPKVPSSSSDPQGGGLVGIMSYKRVNPACVTVTGGIMVTGIRHIDSNCGCVR